MPSTSNLASTRNPRKRRKLSVESESSGQGEDNGGFSADSNESDDHHSANIDSVSSPPPLRQRRDHAEPQKPRRRVHIVQNHALLHDEFFSQVPPPSQEPHRLRGAFWQMPRPAPPSPALPVVTPKERSEGAVASIQSPSGMPMPTHVLPGSREVREKSARRQDHYEEHVQDDMENETALLEELADIPFDMLSSPVEETSRVNQTDPEVVSQIESDRQYAERLSAPSRITPVHTSFRQTTLLGTQATNDGSASQAGRNSQTRNWPLAGRDEAPTHHELNAEELQTWIYPTNLGTIRDYQFNIVSRGLFHNLLVALPTGLGKTFIAATIMLNWFRWTKSAQIVFVAPTRPLVAQQVRACFEIAGIPRSTTSLLTGNVAPGLRAIEWTEKRVFFMTPQTIVNDLKTGICDPKRIVLVVVDEAHRATGNYAYVEVVRFLRRFNNSFRVLALTATPGSTTDAVQEVIDGLGIARTEIRTEESIDIRQYVHSRNIDTELFDYSEDTEFVMDLLSAAIKPVLQKINSLNVYWSKDPMTLTAYGCLQARQKWMASPAGRNANFGLKAMVNAILTTLASLAHAIELLKFHGIVPFYNKMIEYRDGEGEGKSKGGKYKTMIVQHEDFKTMMSTIRQWVRKEDFVGHPKLDYLSRVVLNHFIDAGEGRGVAPDISPAATRIMIFAHFRDSAEEIARVLKRHSPMVRPHVFVGQAASRGSEGMDQKKQQAIIDDFKKGVYNTLVATSIGEEGLDIGQVDLIICYDASASPIRMLQRMGRTGRKRAGNIVVLLMKKKEQENFEKAKDNYEKMQQMIADGSYFNYHDGLSPRILPKGVNPLVDKRVVDIPPENSQADAELPEPKKKGRPPKRPPKKFHMPDGVMTGFLKASEIDQDNASHRPSKQDKGKAVAVDPLPDIQSVLLTPSENEDLEHRYLDIGGDEVQVVEYPRLDRFTELQRQERPSKLVGHGSATWRVIQLLNNIHDIDDATIASWRENLSSKDKALADTALRGEARLLDEPAITQAIPVQPIVSAKSPVLRNATKRKAKQTPKKTSRPTAKRNKREHDVPASDLISSLPGTEGEGIDLLSTDDERDLDDDDNGSDLLDFIDDSTPVNNMTSSSSPPESCRVKGNRGNFRTTETTIPTATQDDTDDDVEGIDDLLSTGKKSSTDAFASIARRPRPGRAVIADDSDEE